MENKKESIHHSRAAAERLMQIETIAEEVLDDEGYARELYTLPSGDQILFRGRDDVYFPPVATKRNPSILTIDEKPHTTSELEAPALKDPAPFGENLFIANATPIGIVDLAIALSSADSPTKKLSELRNNLSKRKFGDKENALLDMMSAAVYNPDSHKDTGAPDMAGLIDVALALNGDEIKTKILHEKLTAFEDAERQVTLSELGDLALDKLIKHEKTVSPEARKLAEGIVLVRATTFDPELSNDGSIVIKSASNYTHDIQYDGEGSAFIPRETIHFSLNHYVKSHMGGDFSNRPYTIVAPLNRALDSNGPPARLADVDTYFMTNPGETITLPDSIVISPDNEQTEIVRRQGNRVFFKAKNFSEDDLSKIATAYRNGEFSKSAEEIRSDIYVDEVLKDRLFRFAEEQAMFIDQSNNSVVKYAVETGKVPDWHIAPPLDRYKALAMNFSELSSYIAARRYGDSAAIGYDLPLSSLLSEIITEGAIVDQGGVVVQGGAHYTSSPELQNKVRELSDLMKVEGGLHSNTLEQIAEEKALEQLYRQGEPSPYDTKINQIINNPFLPHKIRRSYIANGLLVARGKLPPVDDGFSGI